MIQQVTKGDSSSAQRLCNQLPEVKLQTPVPLTENGEQITILETKLNAQNSKARPQILSEREISAQPSPAKQHKRDATKIAKYYLLVFNPSNQENVTSFHATLTCNGRAGSKLCGKRISQHCWSLHRKNNELLSFVKDTRGQSGLTRNGT